MLVLASQAVHKRSASPRPSQAALLAGSSLYEHNWAPHPAASPWAEQDAVPWPAHLTCSFFPLPACSRGQVPAQLLLGFSKGIPGQHPLPTAPRLPPALVEQPPYTSAACSQPCSMPGVNAAL